MRPVGAPIQAHYEASTTMVQAARQAATVGSTHPHMHAPHIVCPSALVQSNLSRLEREVDQAILRKPETVYVELSAVESAESAGLEWLLTAQNRLAAQGIHMVLVNPSATLSDVLIATRLDGRFQVERPTADTLVAPAAGEK